MAFICKPCHNAAEERAKKRGVKHPHPWGEHMTFSQGPCEDCKKVDVTVDCHVY